MVAIVSQDKIVTGRYRHRAKLTGSGRVRAALSPAGIRSVRVRIRLIVDEYLAVNDLYSFTRQSDNAFYEIFASVNRVYEDHHISPFWITDGNRGCADQREFDPVYKLVDQNMVSNK